MVKRTISIVAIGFIFLALGYGLNRLPKNSLPGVPGNGAAKVEPGAPQKGVSTVPPAWTAQKSTAKPQSKPKAKPLAAAPTTPKPIIAVPLPPTPDITASSADIAQVEKLVVDLVNRDRKKFGLPPVSWDETAARAARQHVQEETDYGYISHWGMDGAKPQLRYSKAGGLDAVDENESVSLWLQGGFNGLSRNELYNIVAQHEAMMLNEQSPNDGHRKNILDPHHTGVGIAIAVGKYGVAMAQEFTNHYAELNSVPLVASQGTTVNLSGRIFPGYQITGIYAVWETLPQPMSRAQLMQTHSYSDPPWDNLHFWARPNADGYYIPTGGRNVFAKNIRVDNQGNFSVNVPLANKPCLDYLTLEIAPNGTSSDRFYAGQFVIMH